MTGRNILLSIILVLICSFQNNINAQDFWYPYSNIDSVIIQKVVVKPSGEIFATGGGVFRSIDHGTSWVELGPCTATDQGIAIDSYGSIYVEGCDTIFKSFDNGDSWLPVFTAPHGLWSYSMKTGYDSIVLMGGVIAGAIVRSGDYGATWKIVLTFPGGSWQWVTDFLFSTDGVIYATTVHAEYGDPTLFKSTDYGNTWTAILTWGSGDAYTYSVAEDLQGNILLGSLGDGLYRFYDVNPPLFSRLTPGTIVNGIVVNGNDKYYLSTSDEGGPGHGGCIVFDNNDSSWIQQNSGMNNTFSGGMTVDETGHLLLWGDGGIYRSNDVIITDVKPQKDLPKPGFSIYPNPCNKYFVINRNNPSLKNKLSQIMILGNDGKLLFQETGNFTFPLKLNMDGYPKGLLCLSIWNAGHYYTYKIIHD